MARPELREFIYPLVYSCLNGLVLGHEEDCDHLDTSTKSHIGYLQCHENGCCGDFKDRYCCIGPIVTVAIIFGVFIGTLIVIVIVGVCYSKYKKRQKQQVQVVPSIVTDSYSDIPLPSPPVSMVRVPPVYNHARLHPPAFTPQPFKNLKFFDNNEIHPPPSNLHPPRLHLLN